MSQDKPQLRVAMVGYGFMGAAHSQGWRVAPRFFDLDADPVMTVIVGRDAERVEEAREKFGWERAETDWRRVVADPEIDVVDICSPGDSHAEIAIAALDAGKHVLCEKPLANTVEEAERMVAGGRARGRARHPFDGRIQLPPGARHRVRARAHRGRASRRHPADPRRIPAGLAGRRERPDDVAPRQGARRLGVARRHRSARDRHDPVPDRLAPSSPSAGRSRPS